MELGVYIRDRGQNPNRWRKLDSEQQSVYVIGRPTEDDCPDITLHDGHISQRHAILIYEDAGYWTVTSLGRHGSILIRNGTRKALTKGDAIALEDDDILEVWGADFAITFNTDMDETIGWRRSLDTQDDNDDAQDVTWWVTLQMVYTKAGIVERIAILLVVAIVAIAAIVRWL